MRHSIASSISMASRPPAFRYRVAHGDHAHPNCNGTPPAPARPRRLAAYQASANLECMNDVAAQQDILIRFGHSRSSTAIEVTRSSDVSSVDDSSVMSSQSSDAPLARRGRGRQRKHEGESRTMHRPRGRPRVATDNMNRRRSNQVRHACTLLQTKCMLLVRL
jgi:hypothetical protein